MFAFGAGAEIIVNILIVPADGRRSCQWEETEMSVRRRFVGSCVSLYRHAEICQRLLIHNDLRSPREL